MSYFASLEIFMRQGRIGNKITVFWLFSFLKKTTIFYCNLNVKLITGNNSP